MMMMTLCIQKLPNWLAAIFQNFLKAWFGRLTSENLSFNCQEIIQRDWSEIPDIQQLEIGRKTPENPYP